MNKPDLTAVKAGKAKEKKREQNRAYRESHRAEIRERNRERYMRKKREALRSMVEKKEQGRLSQ